MHAVNPVETKMFGDLVQIGIVVKDLERTVKVLSEVFGLGPFRTIVSPPPDTPDLWRKYHGQLTKMKVRQAFAEVGNLEIELIQPLEGQSIWADFLAQHGEGIHHIRFNVADIDKVVKQVAQHGIGVSQSGEGLIPGTTWVNLDTEDKVGFTIEVMNVAPGSDGRTPRIVDGKVQL